MRFVVFRWLREEQASILQAMLPRALSMHPHQPLSPRPAQQLPQLFRFMGPPPYHPPTPPTPTPRAHTHTPPTLSPPARPNVVLQIKNYSAPNAAEGRQRARSDVPFMFKAFETGQAPPPRPGTKKAEVRPARHCRPRRGCRCRCCLA